MPRKRALQRDSSGFDATPHGGFGLALLFVLIGFALGAGATFFAWRYNLVSLAATAPASDGSKASQRASKPANDQVAATEKVQNEVSGAPLPRDPREQNDLAVMYQLGKGVKQNDSEAIKWYRKAAERNLPLAQSNLGWMLEHGRGVDTDPVSAMFWYKLAAHGGEPNGQYNLALLYEQGIGTARDRTLALEWYDKAAQQGFAPAREAAGQLRVALARETASASASASSVTALAGAAANETAPAQSAAPVVPGEQAAASANESPPAVLTPLTLAVDVDNAFDGSGYAGTWHQRGGANAKNQVTYRADKEGARVLITPALPLHGSGSAQPAAAKSVAEALQWQLPRLVLLVENTTGTVQNMTALEVRVQRSEMDRSAVMFVPSETSGMLQLENIGWGKAKRPQLKIGFAAASALESTDALSAETTATLDLDDLDEGLRVALQDRVPSALHGPAVTVFGRLSYATEEGDQRVLPFKTLARFDRALAPRRWQPRFFHHILLESGKTGAMTLPLVASVGAQRSTQIKLRIGSDRSARYDLVLALKSADGAVMATQALDLQIFVPRFDAAAIVRSPSPLKVASR
jgi:TPR repeat protein